MRFLTRRVLAAAILGAAVATGATAKQPPGGAPPAGPPPTTQPGTPPTTLPSVTPTPQPAAPPVKRPEGIAVTVNNQQIPEVAVWRALRQFPEAEHAVARKEILTHLIENALIDQYLNALKVAVEPAEVDKLIGELKQELAKAKKDYAKELEMMMLTEAEFRSEVTAQMKWDKFVQQQGTDQKLEAFFNQRPDIFDGTLVRAKHILLTPNGDAMKSAEGKKFLEAVKQTVIAEADKAAAAAQGDALAKDQAKTKRIDELFSAYAKEHSKCPSKDNGGDLQFFPRVGAMVEPFAEAAFKLNIWQMSDVVETEFGLHLILVTAKNPGKPRKFAEVKEDVRAVYAMQLRQAVVGQMKPKAQISQAQATVPAPPPMK